ncbi:uncharacterized protein N7469_001293 [Penicillium citrinum]|uniref:Uncharacterized protein n=1 Tax=Penicillium citrinum TaxID=5077 RepID=A0A9W9TVL0_PENCI|nr:uncharacterized protein N7469_001293 [Penicillium citrinum]KAJ5242966.1 hypothetical protein N7469_001293 [Penicillium citrinum]
MPLVFSDLTRVKDLDSPWAHEYVQFIVEDIASKERARIYAERGTDKEMSEVVPWAAIGHNPFTFGRDSVDGITIGYNESKGIKFPPNKGEDKPKEENPKPIIPGRWGGKNAEDFDKSRAGPIDGALPKSRGVTTPMSNIQALKGFLLDRDTMESYLEVLKENDISVTSTNVKEYLDEAAENAKEEENQAAELRYTEQFDKEVDDLEKKVVGAMSDEEKGEFYAKVEHDVATSAQDASGITAKDLDLDGPQAKRYYLVYELMEILADEVDAEAKAGTSYR